MANWQRQVHGTIATAVKDARRGRFTADGLADQTSKLNYPVSRAQIANYESGRKSSLDVCELLVIAGALNVPALSLLFPGLPNAPTQMLPGQSATTAHAKTQFVGDQGLLWPGNEIQALMEQLHRLNAAMAGMGALAATAEWQSP